MLPCHARRLAQQAPSTLHIVNAIATRLLATSAAATSAPGAGQQVTVTGATGFIASQLVASLLERGYTVVGTVRSSKDAAKVAHLTALSGASQRLRLVEADLVKNPAGFDRAVDGSVGVFHTASPFFLANITDPDNQLLKPAVQGTLAVLESVKKSGKSVRRVVLTSSVAAIQYRAMPPTHVFSGATWSDKELLQSKKLWYQLSKTLAEEAAWNFVTTQSPSFDLATVCPTLVIGPLLQPVLNTSSEIVLDMMNGVRKELPRASMGSVDVRDVAMSHIRAFECPEAGGQRYMCIEGSYLWTEWIAALKAAYPGAAYATAVAPGQDPPALRFDNSGLRKLGVVFRPFAESIRDTAHSLVRAGFYKNHPSDAGA